MILTSCEDADVRICEVDSVPTNKIENGWEDVDDKFPEVACVGGDWHPQGYYRVCATGTMVTPSMFITARHNQRGGRVPIKFGQRPRIDGPDFAINGARCFEMRNTGLKTCCAHQVKPDENSSDQEVRKWENYLRTCPDPIMDYSEEYIISDLAVWRLSQRYELPYIKTLLQNPDGTKHFHQWDKKIGIMVGYGREKEVDGETGVRRYHYMEMFGPSISLFRATEEKNYLKIGQSRYRLVEFVSIRGGDSGGPILVDIEEKGRAKTCHKKENLRLVGTIHTEKHASMTLDRSVTPHLIAMLDPNEDGIHVGEVDGDLPGYIDIDGDGMAEYDDHGKATGNDNCMPLHDIGNGTYNPLQENADGDWLGDICDPCPTKYGTSC